MKAQDQEGSTTTGHKSTYSGLLNEHVPVYIFEYGMNWIVFDHEHDAIQGPSWTFACHRLSARQLIAAPRPGLAWG